MLIWCLKQVKDFILNFSISRSFLSEKEFWNLHTVLLASFPSGVCVDKIVDNRANHQGYECDAYSVQYHT